MLCSHCGKCCKETEMELDINDIKRLERLDYDREDFTVIDKDGVVRLRNSNQWCFFYDSDRNRCRVYPNRPIGCYLYPVVYLVNYGIIIDDLCPTGDTISKQELRTKGRILIKLVKNMTIRSKL